ncbi:phage tail assembly chaperone, partial [Caulobacter sp. HMWF025]|uniref:phage tail assembly chaperone n=1 Tax=Caulobacter sp. HMWF025 TaxID=2056860 RepID=UPI000D3B5B6B
MSDWTAALQRAAALSIAPDAFWRLSLVEWRALTAAPSLIPVLGRPGLEALIDLYPDEET